MVDHISVKSNVTPGSAELSRYEHVSNIEFKSVNKSCVKLLTGARMPKAFGVEEVRCATDSCFPDAIRSPLAWSLFGLAFSDAHFASDVCTCLIKFEDIDDSLEDVCAFVQRHFQRRQESFTLLKDSDHLVEYHYELSLPWRDKGQIMPDNKSMAWKRVHLL